MILQGGPKVPKWSPRELLDAKIVSQAVEMKAPQTATANKFAAQLMALLTD